MWRIEDVLSELKDEEDEAGKNDKSGLAPGFRFHPTDEELITFYLASKVFNHPTTTTTTPSTSSSASSSAFATAIDIAEVDLNRCEPWDLPERARMGEREWYFYSLRDRKYPTGLRTNRATGSGYWKATGKDRQVYSAATTAAAKTGTAAGGSGGALIGMKKTLVFYQGRAPRGVKTRWVMHEYRLDGHFSSFRLSSKQEEWVICRIFHKHGHGGGGAEKKHSPITTRRPFLDSLPPLLETQAQTQTQTQTLDSLSHLLPQHHQDHTNFLLNSLLNNQHHRLPPPPLQFSTAATTINDLLPPSTLFNYLKPLPASITSNAGVPKQSNPEMEQQKQNWMGKIWPQIQHPNNCPLLSCYDDELYPPHPFSGGGGGSGGDGAVHVDMSASGAALDRILHPLPPLP